MSKKNRPFETIGMVRPGVPRIIILGTWEEMGRASEDTSNDWLGNTVTMAMIQEIGLDDGKWHTLGTCIDTPNKIKTELAKPEYQGHDVWIRNTFGERHYHGTVK